MEFVVGKCFSKQNLSYEYMRGKIYKEYQKTEELKTLLKENFIVVSKHESMKI